MTSKTFRRQKSCSPQKSFWRQAICWRPKKYWRQKIVDVKKVVDQNLDWSKVFFFGKAAASEFTTPTCKINLETKTYSCARACSQTLNSQFPADENCELKFCLRARAHTSRVQKCFGQIQMLLQDLLRLLLLLLLLVLLPLLKQKAAAAAAAAQVENERSSRSSSTSSSSSSICVRKKNSSTLKGSSC